MGSLTSSLLSASADKREQDANNLKQSQESPDSKSSTQSTAQPTAAQKAVSKGEKAAGSAIEAGAKKVLGMFKDGGTVPETGHYMVHEGEKVVPAKRASEYRKVYLGRKSKKD